MRILWSSFIILYFLWISVRQTTLFVKIIEKLKSKLGAHLRDFEKNKEWADIGSWLIKVETYLKDNQTPFVIIIY